MDGLKEKIIIILNSIIRLINSVIKPTTIHGGQARKIIFFLCIAFFVYRIFSSRLSSKVPIESSPSTTKGSFFSKFFQFGKEKNEEIDLDSLDVRAKQIKPEKRISSITALGSIEYFEKIDIVSKVAGNIEAIYVKEGENVQKGQLLAQIEKLQLELELKKNQAQLDSALSAFKLSQEKYEKAKNAVEIKLLEINKRTTQVKELKVELDRIRTTYAGREVLLKEGGISKEEFENTKTNVVASEAKYLLAKKDLEMSQIGFRDQDLKTRGMDIPKDPEKKILAYEELNTKIEKAELDVAQSQVNSARAAVESTEQLLITTTIRSPIDGIVAVRNKHVGEYVNQGSVQSSDQAIMVLVSIDKIYAKMNIRESELKSLTIGMTMDFAVDVYPDDKFRAKISIINPIVDPKTHTVEIKALLNNDQLKLRPGMFLRGILSFGKPEFFLLAPSSSILPKQGDNAWIFLLKNGVAYKTEITTGRHFDDDVEIKSGLEPGDIIATEKFSQLKEGIRVRPIISDSILENKESKSSL